MNTIVVWMLIISTTSSRYSDTPVIYQNKFASENDCNLVAEQIYAKSLTARMMPTIRGICVQAKIIKE